MEQTIAYEAVETRVLVDGVEIRRLRILAGLSQWELGVRCGWSQTRQWQFEKRGRHEMSEERLLTIIDECNKAI